MSIPTTLTVPDTTIDFDIEPQEPDPQVLEMHKRIEAADHAIYPEYRLNILKRAVLEAGFSDSDERELIAKIDEKLQEAVRLSIDNLRKWFRDDCNGEPSGDLYRAIFQRRQAAEALPNSRVLLELIEEFSAEVRAIDL